MAATLDTGRVIGALALSARPHMARRVFALCATSFALFSGSAHATTVHDQIAALVDPYVRSGNFSGSIQVVQSGHVVFRDSYGRSDQAAANRADTRYHAASISMMFTAAAVMRLVERGRLSLDARVSQFAPNVPNGDRITVAELLQQTSGLPDANDLPGYDDLLNAHQTPESLVQFIRGRPSRFEPGTPSQDEEHSAYNMLVLISEKVTGRSFKDVVRREVFAPLRMNNSGIDDDSPIGGPVASGHEENGLVSLRAAPVIHWSTKAGSGSAYSTIGDMHRFLTGFFSDGFLSTAHRRMLLNGRGGWEKDDEPRRFKEIIYFQSGNGGGFASVAIHLPRLRTDIVILSNCQIPVPPSMGFNLAAMLEGGEYRRLEVRAAPLTPDEISHVVGSYAFGADFYRRNATLQLAADADGGLILKWPGSDGPARDTPVIIVDDHHFIDRHYWTRFSLTDDPRGRASRMTFGPFNGTRSIDGPRAATH